MANHLIKNAGAQDYVQKQERLLVPFFIDSNATPASKSHASDLPGVVYLSTEGKTAEATAVDSGTSFATADDANGVFSVLLANLGTVEKLLDVSLVNLSSGTATVSRKGASTTGVTASGNIAVSIDWNGNLATTDLTATIVVDYRISKN